MNQIIISIFLGMFPEVLYFTLFFMFVKEIKEKRIQLFILMSIAYIMCVMLNRYTTAFYFLFIAVVYCILKKLYKDKTELIDICVFSIATLYLTIVSAIPYILIKNYAVNYWICYILARISLFLPFVFKRYFNLLYVKYKKIWNVNKDKVNGIKSITVRNISIIIIALLVSIINTSISIKIS